MSRNFRPGNVLFYDMKGRGQIRDIEVRGLMDWAFYHLQRKYDRMSHSGVYIEWTDAYVATHHQPAILHSVGGRVKYLNILAAWCYLLKREVDFAKVFVGWSQLDSEFREGAEAQYREA